MFVEEKKCCVKRKDVERMDLNRRMFCQMINNAFSHIGCAYSLIKSESLGIHFDLMKQSKPSEMNAE